MSKRVTVELNELGFGHVEIDGHRVSVQSIHIECQACLPTKITIELPPFHVSADLKIAELENLHILGYVPE